MPTIPDILAMLTRAANEAILVAIAWHVVLALIAIALIAGRRPSIQTAMATSGAMLASVAAVGFVTGNPFNGFVYAALAITAAIFASRAPDRPARIGPAWMAALGIALIAVGWVYPHFLAGSPAWYLVAAPVGVVPCATLYVVIGATLLGGGLGSRGWMLTFAALGLVYGITGVVTLRVYLDVGLIAGAAGLLVAAAHPARAQVIGMTAVPAR